MQRFSTFFASLRSRLLLLVLLAVVPALGLTLYTYAELRHLTAADEQREALRLARIAADDQEDTIKDTRQLLFALAQLPEVHSASPAACSVFFARLLNQYPQYALLGAAGRDGNLICSVPATDDLVNLVDRDYFRRILQTRDYAIGEYQSDPINDRATLDLGYPVPDETGRVQAVVFASLDLAWLNQLAAEAQLPEGSTLLVVDRNGTILVRYPDPEVWVGQSAPEAPIVRAILAQQGEGTAEARGVDGVSRLFAFTSLSDIPGGEEVYVGVGIPTAVAFASTNRVLVRNLAGLGLVAVLALAAAWFGGDLFILRWVNRLVDATKRLSAGDLSARTDLPYGEGELSQLAYAFDEMAESLERRVTERDRAEEALQESQRILSTLMSNLPGMAYRCRSDGEWTMEFVSEGCFGLTGYRPTELIKNRKISYGQLIHPMDRESAWNAVQTALQENRSFQITYRVITATGEEKWAWEQGRGVFSPAGDLLALEGYVIDATEQVLAQEKLEQRVADRTRELAALYEIMAVASASLDLETILKNSLDRVLTVIGSKVGAVHLYDEASGVLRLAAQRGISQRLATTIDAVPVENGLAGWVIEHGQPLVVPDVANGLRPLLALPGGSLQAYVGAPIRAKGRVLGALSVVGEAGRPFKDNEVSLLSSIADQVGVAVENARLYQQAEQLAVVRERERLARELHDSVTQSLYSLMLLADAGWKLMEAGDLERVRGYLERLGEISQQALKEMRLLVYELRPLVLKREGLAGALQQRLDAVEKRAGMDVRLLVEGEVELPSPVEEELYRIAQEALNNTLKHAAATSVTVNVRGKRNRVELRVVDNGVGFDPDAMSDQGGMGLVSMRERAEKLGGVLAVLSAPGEGTRVIVEVSYD
jgi:signal transduction histidine kinase/PAS domain-containing protein